MNRLTEALTEVHEGDDSEATEYRLTEAHERVGSDSIWSGVELQKLMQVAIRFNLVLARNTKDRESVESKST